MTTLDDFNSGGAGDDEEIHSDVDICRVCRMETTLERPLHYPCLCTGSIKYIHQECLVQWLNHSKKEYCELCNHKFIFKPVYSPDMPKSMPPQELLSGLGKNILRALRCWLHYTLVVVAWLGVVPLTAFRIYKCLFSGSLNSLLTLPVDMLSFDSAFTDCLFGGLVVAVSVGGFIMMLWLREQILVHGGPVWLNEDNENDLPRFRFDEFFMNLFRNQEPIPEADQQLIDPPAPLPPVEDEPLVNRMQHVPAADDPFALPHDQNVIQPDLVRQENAEGYAPPPEPVAQPEMEPFLLENMAVPPYHHVEEMEDHEEELLEDHEEDILEQLRNDGILPDANNGNPDEAEGVEENDLLHNNHADERGWNPDAIMEDLTWEKFLGLDGSFIFLEHVFWIISLNTSFVLVFAFCPYHLGQMFLNFFDLQDEFTGTTIDGVVILFIGYIIITTSLVSIHFLLRYTGFKKSRQTIGLCYTVLKVSLLMIIEVGLFPLVCGWWLDICSLPLIAITTKERKESFLYAPATATFLHWLVGMLYVFYFAAFIMLLREILRPGVLWFLRNINDPQFHPVREMIQLSVVRHTRRFLLSLVVFGTTVLVFVWIPVQLVKRCTKGLIPFNVSLSSDAPISEMSLELLLLQIILPAFLEQGHARRWFKMFIQHWAKAVAYVLDLRSYLIGDVEIRDFPASMVMHVDNNGKWQRGHPPRGTLLENQLGGVGSPTVRAYVRTSYFKGKIVLFLGLVVISVVTASFSLFTLPVVIGRMVLSLVFGDTVIHELYTAAAGFYMLWLVLRVVTVLSSWYPVGFRVVYEKVKSFVLLVLKIVVASIVVLLVIPLFLGVLFELVVMIPVRVPLDQTPLLYVWQDWALGVLHLKIMCALVMIGPDWWLRDAIDRAYRNGFGNMDLMFILQKIVYPVLMSLLLIITTPYVLVAGVLPILGFDKPTVVLCLHRVYPLLMFTVALVGLVIFQGKQFKSLIEKIKNEKYLIGKVLVNYEPKNRNKDQATNT